MPSARPVEGLFAPPRPVSTVADLLANIWQLGYVTNDLERAVDQLRARLGLEHLVTLPALPASAAVFLREGDEPAPFEAKFAMGARGGLIVELIEPVSGEVGFYNDALPEDGSFAIVLHHFAGFIPTGDEEWERLRGVLATAGMRIDYTFVIPDRVRGGYVDTRAQLGHFLEICQLERADLDFFRGLISDSA